MEDKNENNQDYNKQENSVINADKPIEHNDLNNIVEKSSNEVIRNTFDNQKGEKNDQIKEITTRTPLNNFDTKDNQLEGNIKIEEQGVKPSETSTSSIQPLSSETIQQSSNAIDTGLSEYKESTKRDIDVSNINTTQTKVCEVKKEKSSTQLGIEGCDTPKKDEDYVLHNEHTLEVINAETTKDLKKEINNENLGTNKYFYENLMKVISTQENILNITSNSRDKLIVINGVAHEQLKNFKENYTKYGKFFKLIQTELASIADLMK